MMGLSMGLIGEACVVCIYCACYTNIEFLMIFH